MVQELRAARPVARSRLTRGTVVWAVVPFRDRDGSKTRPCVVTGLDGRDVHLFPITSSSKESVRSSRLSVRLEEWDAAGLSRPCLVSRHPVVVDIRDVTTIVGELSERDAARVFAAE